MDNHGNAWARSATPDKVIAFYEQRLIIAREMGDQRGEASALDRLVVEWKNVGEAIQSIEFDEQALTIAHKNGDGRAEASGSFNLALSLDMLGRRALATSPVAHALGILQAIECPHAKTARRTLSTWRDQI